MTRRDWRGSQPNSDQFSVIFSCHSGICVAELYRDVYKSACCVRCHTAFRIIYINLYQIRYKVRSICYGITLLTTTSTTKTPKITTTPTTITTLTMTLTLTMTPTISHSNNNHLRFSTTFITRKTTQTTTTTITTTTTTTITTKTKPIKNAAVDKVSLSYPRLRGQKQADCPELRWIRRRRVRMHFTGSLAAPRLPPVGGGIGLQRRDRFPFCRHAPGCQPPGPSSRGREVLSVTLTWLVRTSHVRRVKHLTAGVVVTFLVNSATVE